MFNKPNLREMLPLSGPSGQQELARLTDRIAELEAENAGLRRLDETLRKNARLFDAILQRCREGILLLTPDMIVLRLVHSAAGYEEAELSGQSILSRIHPDDASRFQNAFSEVLSAQAKSVSCEFRIREKDGSWCWLAGEMTDLLDDPDVQAVLLNARRIIDCNERAPGC